MASAEHLAAAAAAPAALAFGRDRLLLPPARVTCRRAGVLTWPHARYPSLLRPTDPDDDVL